METIPLGALPLNHPGVAPPKGRGLVRATTAGSARWRCGAAQVRSAHPGPALHRPSPNGLRISGAEGVRCMRGLGGLLFIAHPHPWFPVSTGDHQAADEKQFDRKKRKCDVEAQIHGWRRVDQVGLR